MIVTEKLDIENQNDLELMASEFISLMFPTVIYASRYMRFL